MGTSSTSLRSTKYGTLTQSSTLYMCTAMYGRPSVAVASSKLRDTTRASLLTPRRLLMSTLFIASSVVTPVHEGKFGDAQRGEQLQRLLILQHGTPMLEQVEASLELDQLLLICLCHGFVKAGLVACPRRLLKSCNFCNTVGCPAGVLVPLRFCVLLECLRPCLQPDWLVLHHGAGHALNKLRVALHNARPLIESHHVMSEAVLLLDSPLAIAVTLPGTAGF